MTRPAIVFAILSAIAGTTPLTGSTALGQSWPYSSSSDSPNGQFRYVRISPLTIDQQLQDARESVFFNRDRVDSLNVKIRSIAEQYSASGMYRVDNPGELLWQVQASYDAAAGIPSNDGQSVIRYGNVFDHYPGEVLLIVYRADGSTWSKEIYSVIPLVQSYLRQFLGNWYWGDFQEIEITNANTIIARSKDNDWAEFSLPNGQLLGASAWPATLRIVLSCWRGQLFALISGILIFFTARRILSFRLSGSQ